MKLKLKVLQFAVDDRHVALTSNVSVGCHVIRVMIDILNGVFTRCYGIIVLLRQSTINICAYRVINIIATSGTVSKLVFKTEFSCSNLVSFTIQQSASDRVKLECVDAVSNYLIIS